MLSSLKGVQGVAPRALPSGFPSEHRFWERRAPGPWGATETLSTESGLKKQTSGTSLAVQWLGLPAPTAEGTGSIPGRGTTIPHAPRHGQKKKKKETWFKIALHSRKIA